MPKLEIKFRSCWGAKNDGIIGLPFAYEKWFSHCMTPYECTIHEIYFLWFNIQISHAYMT